MGLACDACSAAGKGEECSHKLASLPPWKSADRQRMLQTIMGNDTATFAREALGLVASSDHFIFKPFVQRLSRNLPFALVQNVGVVYLAIDPSGGGTGSEYALVGTACIDGLHVVRQIRQPRAVHEHIEAAELGVLRPHHGLAIEARAHQQMLEALVEVPQEGGIEHGVGVPTHVTTEVGVAIQHQQQQQHALLRAQRRPQRQQLRLHQRHQRSGRHARVCVGRLQRIQCDVTPLRQQLHVGVTRTRTEQTLQHILMLLHAQVTNVDSSPSVQSADVHLMMLRHVQAIRDHPMTARALIVLIVEANMSYLGADHVVGLLGRADLQPMHVVSRDASKKGRPGVWTGENEKMLYAAELERVLAAGALRRANPLLGQPKSAVAAAKWEKLVTQIGMFRRTVRNPHDEVFQNFKIAFSGKGGGNADDLCMALQMALYWGGEVRRDPSFQNAAQENGWQM